MAADSNTQDVAKGPYEIIVTSLPNIPIYLIAGAKDTICHVNDTLALIDKA